jgi:hypothetical protein
LANVPLVEKFAQTACLNGHRKIAVVAVHRIPIESLDRALAHIDSLSSLPTVVVVSIDNGYLKPNVVWQKVFLNQ